MTSIEELKQDCLELETLLGHSIRPRIKDLLVGYLGKLRSEISSMEEAIKVTNNGSSQTPKKQFVSLQNYAWDQSDKFMKLFVTIEGVHNVDASNISCEFTTTSVTLNVYDLKEKNYRFVMKNLCESISASSSYYKLKNNMVLLMLSKEKSGKTWSSVVRKEEKNKEIPEMPPVDEEKDPSDGMMDMMKKLYNEGDDEMKRMIAKSWTESREKKNTTDN